MNTYKGNMEKEETEFRSNEKGDTQECCLYRRDNNQEKEVINSYSCSAKVKEDDNCCVARERWELKQISELCDKEVFVDLTAI